MHELSIADALVKQVEAIVAREGARKAVAVTIEAGPMSGVDPDALQAAFPLIAETAETVSGARLEIVPATCKAVCRRCGAEHDDFKAEACAKCGAIELDRRGVRDLTFRSVELEFD